MNKSVIIVAGGRGERMNSIVPKQFLHLGCKPVLMRTLEVFYSYCAEIQIIAVLPGEQFEYWKKLCEEYNFSIPHTLVAGGDTRFQSVKNALAAVDAENLVAIHDGVRPLVSADTVSRCFDAAELDGAAIPVIEVADSLRQICGSENRAAERKNFRLVQTPQIFNGKLLKDAYSQDFSESFTDDASVVESAGAKITLVEGNRENIKITNPADLILANALIEK